MSDKFTEGFEILTTLSLAELEKRVEWFENALAAYKTLLMVRRVMANKPDGLVVPPEFKELQEGRPPDKRKHPENRLSSVEAVKKITELLLASGEPLSSPDMATKMGQSVQSLNHHLEKGRGIHFRRIARECGKGYLWELTNKTQHLRAVTG